MAKSDPRAVSLQQLSFSFEMRTNAAERHFKDNDYKFYGASSLDVEIENFVSLTIFLCVLPPPQT